MVLFLYSQTKLPWIFHVYAQGPIFLLHCTLAKKYNKKNMQTLIVLSHANTDVYNTYNFALDSGVGTWNWKGCLLKHYLKNSYVFCYVG